MAKKSKLAGLKPPASRKGTTCTVTAFMDLHPEERDALQSILGDPSWTGAEVARTLTSHFDFKVSSGAVLRHRRAECQCAS